MPCRVVLPWDVLCPNIGRNDFFQLSKLWSRLAHGPNMVCYLFVYFLRAKNIFTFFNHWESIKRIIFVTYEIRISVFKKKFYQNLAALICLCTDYGCFYTTVAELSSFDDSMSCKAQNIYWSFTGKVCRLHLCFRGHIWFSTTDSILLSFPPSGTMLPREILGPALAKAIPKVRGSAPPPLLWVVGGGQLMVKIPVCCFCLPSHYVHFSLGVLSLSTQSSRLSGPGPYSLMPWVDTDPDLSNQLILPQGFSDENVTQARPINNGDLEILGKKAFSFFEVSHLIRQKPGFSRDIFREEILSPAGWA